MAWQETDLSRGLHSKCPAQPHKSVALGRGSRSQGKEGFPGLHFPRATVCPREPAHGSPRHCSLGAFLPRIPTTQEPLLTLLLIKQLVNEFNPIFQYLLLERDRGNTRHPGSLEVSWPGPSLSWSDLRYPSSYPFAFCSWQSRKDPEGIFVPKKNES